MTPDEIQSKFAGAFPRAEKINPGVKGYLTMKLVSPADLIPVAAWLKGTMGFEYLDMVTGVDMEGPADMRGYITDPNYNTFQPEGPSSQTDVPAKNPGFNYREAIELVYLFSNLKEHLKIFLKLEVSRDAAKVPSLCAVFDAADWQEREAFDLLGVRFEGHPNLTKILTPEFIQGNPLRKDYVHVKDKFD